MSRSLAKQAGAGISWSWQVHASKPVYIHAGIQLGNLPGEEALRGMLEFDGSRQPDGTEVGKAVATILNQLGDASPPLKPATSGVPKLIPTGPDLPPYTRSWWIELHQVSMWIFRSCPQPKVAQGHCQTQRRGRTGTLSSSGQKTWRVQRK